MKQTLKTLTLIAIGVAVGRVGKRKKYVSKIDGSLIKMTPNKVISVIR